ncbi:MAG: M14 family zinc carboxypeptidase [Chitinophagales bacterium]
MKRKLLFWIISFCTLHAMAQSAITELYKQDKTPTYEQVINYYAEKAAQYPFISMRAEGLTDAFQPLHLVLFDTEGKTSAEQARAAGKTIILINNGIHPGEPDGIDACIQFTEAYINDTAFRAQCKDLLICIIPVYNIGGALNRGSYSRANQNGPQAYGFRGNAQNYDLNRDFMKCDSYNALAFARIFRQIDPDVFIDTHVSNGADYSYVMTIIPTQKDKLQEPLGTYLEYDMMPALYAGMEKAGFPMCPYVNEIDKTPDNGIAGFLDLARYSTGYTSLYQTIGFMPETHMLKPYEQRVASTIAFIHCCISFAAEHGEELQEKRKEAMQNIRLANTMDLNWELDMGTHYDFLFSGYAAKYKPSAVSGLDRLYYDRNEPYTKNIPVYDHYIPSKQIICPKAYIVPRAWHDVVERLGANNVRYRTLEQDSLVEVEMYHIDDVESSETPYEGHYYHKKVVVTKYSDSILFRRGDLYIDLDQPAKRYIIEALEPEAPDSFFAWGMFDAILMQKEWFSDYVFEDLAAEILEKDPALQKQLEDKRASDPAFAADAWEQLRFVYERSVYYEPTYRRYPVGRVVK